MVVRFPDGELGRWACLGATTDRSVRVWLRDPRGDSHLARVHVDGAVAGECMLAPAPEHDWVAGVDVALDRPRPDAEFVVRVAGMERRGRLAPAPGTPTSFTFGFGSCSEPFDDARDGTLAVDRVAGIYPEMARMLSERGARFLFLVGDQIYSDGVDAIRLREEARSRQPPPSEQELRERYRWVYRGYFNQPDYRSLLESLPTLMIWDDHDISDGWGSYLDWDDADDRLFRAAETAYREYQHLHQAGSHLADEPPYHRHFWYGDVGFFVLDLRGVRDYRQGQVLGERQWRDFDRFLVEATDREVRTLFIVASIPIVHHAPYFIRLSEWFPTLLGTDIRDRWSAKPIVHERVAMLDRLLDWQAARPRRQVIVLSGDVHGGAAFRLRRRHAPGSLLQWTSSPLTTRPSVAELVANRLGTRLVNLGDRRYHSRRLALVPTNNFGVVHVEPEPDGGHRVGLTLYAYHPGRPLRAAVRGVSPPLSGR